MEYLRDNVCKILVHRTKIGDVFLQETDSALLDDSSDDVVRMQIRHSIPFIEARSHAVGGPVQLFPPIFFWGAGDLIFRSIKNPKKTDRR